MTHYESVVNLFQPFLSMRNFYKIKAGKQKQDKNYEVALKISLRYSQLQNCRTKLVECMKQMNYIYEKKQNVKSSNIVYSKPLEEKEGKQTLTQYSLL